MGPSAWIGKPNHVVRVVRVVRIVGKTIHVCGVSIGKSIGKAVHVAGGIGGDVSNRIANSPLEDWIWQTCGIVWNVKF